MPANQIEMGTLGYGDRSGTRATLNPWSTEDSSWSRRCRPTRWSVVLAAAAGGDAGRAALGTLYRTYQYPVFAYIAVRRGRERAWELTQAFFVRRLLEKQDLRRVQRTPGSYFRGWLFKAVDSFLKNQWKFERQQCRDTRLTVAWSDQTDAADPSSFVELREAATRALGPAETSLPAAASKAGGIRKICPLGPKQSDAEQLLNRERAFGVLSSVLGRLRREYCEHAASAGVDGEQRFDVVKVFLPGRDMEDARFKAPAAALGLTTAAVKQMVERLKRRFAQLLDEELLRQVVDRETDLPSARRQLCEALEAPPALHEGV